MWSRRSRGCGYWLGEETVIARYHGGREVSDSDSSWANIDVGETAQFMDVSYFGVTANLRGGKFQPIFIFPTHGPFSISAQVSRNGRPIPGMISRARVSE